MTQERLNEIKGRLANATVGPWKPITVARTSSTPTDPKMRSRISAVVGRRGGEPVLVLCHGKGLSWVELSEADLEVILHSSTDLAEMVAYVEMLENERLGAKIG